MDDCSKIPLKSKFSVGTCTTMCPQKEMLLREREKLLHKFEIVSGTEKNKVPKADPDKVIKCYSRSAAGQSKICSSELRPFSVLMKTITYLFHNVFPIHEEKPLFVYDFMFDRLRSVRQDMIIQNLSPFETVSILEPIARFHIYFGYILIEESESNFDQTMNNMHLQECLKRLLVCYDTCHADDNNEVTEKMARLTLKETHLKNRYVVEGAYLLFNLSHVEALTRGVELMDTFENAELLNLSMAWYLKNYVKVFRLMKHLHPLLLCVVVRHIPTIRKYSLRALSEAFSCKNSLYPIGNLRDLLLYESDLQLIDDCNHFNIKISNNNVTFLKSDFDFSAKQQKPKRLLWIDERLQKCDAVRLLCYGSD